VDSDFGLELCSFALVVVGRRGEFGVVRAVDGVVAWSTKGWKVDAFHLPKRSSFEERQ
jgi:hypothetical protein